MPIEDSIRTPLFLCHDYTMECTNSPEARRRVFRRRIVQSRLADPKITPLRHVLPYTRCFRKNVERLISSAMQYIALVDIYPSTDVEIHVETLSKSVNRNIQSPAYAMTSIKASTSRVVTNLQCWITKSSHKSHTYAWLSSEFGNSVIRNSNDLSGVRQIHNDAPRLKSVARTAHAPLSLLLRSVIIFSSLAPAFLRSPYFILVAIAVGILPTPALASPVSVRPRLNEECIPATWLDVFVFIVINYVTHAMTVNSLPGESVAASIFYNIVALLFPFTGAWRGIRAIRSAARFGGSKIQLAARAGALCVVARSMDWRPGCKDKIHGCTVEGSIPVDGTRKARVVVQGYRDCVIDPVKPTEVRIHGQFSLPQGYYIVRVPADVLVSAEGKEPLDIASTQATAKVILSLAQLGFACATLYRARGSQLQEYGYAAFSLTVMPYAIMSFINLTGNLIMPNYPAMYMIRSEVMEEAKARGGRFDGTLGFMPTSADDRKGEQIGGADTVLFDGSDDEKDMVFYNIVEGGTSTRAESSFEAPKIFVPSVGRYVRRTKSPSEKGMTSLAYILVVAGVFLPYIFIAILTGFNPGNSTGNQRLWTMSWLVVGQIAGILMAFLMNDIHDCSGRASIALPGIVFTIPAIGGFVTVAKMMKEFGQCVQLWT